MEKNTCMQTPCEMKSDGYKNPLTRDFPVPDPCIVYSNEHKCYFATYTVGREGKGYIVMHKSEKLGDLFRCDDSKVVYSENENDKTYGPFWAPEMHFIDGKWYIYTSTKNAKDIWQKHILCLKAKSDNPFDGFELAGHINPQLYAIDPTIYQDHKNNKLYISYSIAEKCGKQCVAIQELKSPTETTGEYGVVSMPEYDWEMVAPYEGNWTINEGSYFIEKDDRLFIIYSANGCWCDDYCLGILEFVGNNMLSADSWKKSKRPFMIKGNGNYGPGHATFFYSPDKTELWVCHHCLAASNPTNSPMDRYCHVQKVEFDEMGFPNMHIPIMADTVYNPPSGE